MALMLAWLALSVLGSCYFAFSPDLRRKRKLWPYFLGASTLLFMGISIFFALQSPGAYLLVFAAPAIAFLHYYRVTFCEACGATNGFERGAARRSHCRNCAAALEY